jgi:hypothetical protein
MEMPGMRKLAAVMALHAVCGTLLENWNFIIYTGLHNKAL